MGRLLQVLLPLGFVAALLLGAPARGAASSADQGWLPHPSDATWTYQWTDSAYATTPTTEKVAVSAQTASSFTLAWTTQGLDNPSDAVTSIGSVDFQNSDAGLVNTNWSSNAPPPAFPILCANAVSCGNSLASTYYNVIWGDRAPTLPAPLLAGTTWASTGGATGDVASQNAYDGVENVTVPAFPKPVPAAKVVSQITQAGALGDPYGSGVRTVWWVYGVGPVKVVFQHAGGTGAPVTTSVLQSTSLTPQAAPSDANYFPLTLGRKGAYSWTNTKYLKKPVVERIAIDQVANNSARFVVSGVSGPIKVAGAYGFTTRASGVTNIWAATKAASLAKLPPLGHKRHFFTPFDLMTYGFNPVLPAYPKPGDTWIGDTTGTDYAAYGVTGRATVLGFQNVKVPAGKFNALVVRTTLSQRGCRFGSGTRTSWFAAGQGLVKLVFRHGDGSVSTVELVQK